MRTKIGLALALVVALAAAGAASGAPRHGKVLLRTTSLGRVLVDARGHTLYLFEADHSRKSVCYGKCAAEWPPFLTGAAPLAGAGVKKGLLTTTKRRDGKLQVVYAGHPLYFFSADTKAGAVKGEGLDFFGGEWYVLSAAGKKIEKGSSSGGGTTTTTPTTTTPYPYGP